MTAPNRNFMLTHKPLNLDPIRSISRPSRVIKKLNAYLKIPAFTAPFPSWSGASYIVARIPIRLGKNIAIRLPIQKPSTTFVACIKWNEGIIVKRYKLWSNVNENVDFPMYIGEVIPDSCTALEIWNVSGTTNATNPAEWQLQITELSIPYTSEQVVGTQYDLLDICYTHPNDCTTLDEYFYKCSCNG